MIRLAASLVTIGSLSLPILVYQGEYRKGQDRAGWKDHTYEARSLAERLARHALDGSPAEVLRGDVRAFALKTADNPSQVSRSAWMRWALEAGDAKRLAALAEEAIAEEDRLLPVRREAADRKARQVQSRATAMWAGGVLAAVMQAFQAWSSRRDRP